MELTEANEHESFKISQARSAHLHDLLNRLVLRLVAKCVQHIAIAAVLTCRARFAIYGSGFGMV